MSAIRDDAPGVISFGAAGVLCVGTDAEVRQGCEAILSACDCFVKQGFPCVGEYERVVDYIEERAKIIAPIVAVSPAGPAWPSSSAAGGRGRRSMTCSARCTAASGCNC